jgi:CRP-like cAMP-binding protein
MAPEGLRDLARRSSLVRIPRRQVLSGEPASLFVLGSGRARRVRRSAEREIILEYAGPGDVVGELGVVHPDPASAVAVERVEAVRIGASMVREVLGHYPVLAFRLLELMASRRLDAERRIEALLSRSVEARVADFLVRASERHGIPDERGILIGVRYTHQEIAGYVGSTRETVTVVLGDLRRHGLVLTDHRRLIVTDPNGLRERA